MSSRTMLGKASAIVGAAAALTIAASGIAAASTTITPASTAVTATSSGLSFVTTGGLELYCTSVSGKGSTPTAPGNVNSGTGGIDINIDKVALSGCDLEGVPATITTSGSWALNVNADSGSPMGSIKIPNGGAHVVAGSCVIDVTTSTAGPVPYNNTTHTVAANNTGTVNFTSNGGSASCPAAGAGTAKMTGLLTFNSTPGITVTP
ncbi:hypothetical protein ACFVWF_32595 [Rhodococcus qingshengii]|uniref:hypothetical protein n=1 Tax=Rhodococcus qingshengii TaxID=334542 RepID=UPI0036DF81C4